MDPNTDIAIAVLTVAPWWLSGWSSFARVVRSPGKLLAAMAAQTVLLPLIAFAVIALLDPPIYRPLGLIVIAGCPGGPFSNFFTALARGETALSVALTTACTLLSVVALPVVTAVGFSLHVATAEAVRPPVLLRSGRRWYLARSWDESPASRRPNGSPYVVELGLRNLGLAMVVTVT